MAFKYIYTNKYDILILPGALLIFSSPNFEGKKYITDSGFFHWRNGLLAEHREHSHLCLDLNTPRHELHTPGGGSEPGVTGPIFWYVIAEVFLHNISSGVEIL